MIAASKRSSLKFYEEENVYRTRAEATVRMLAEDTRHVGSLMSLSWRVLGRASCSVRAEVTARFAGSLTLQGISLPGR